MSDDEPRLREPDSAIQDSVSVSNMINTTFDGRETVVAVAKIHRRTFIWHRLSIKYIHNIAINAIPALYVS